MDAPNGCPLLPGGGCLLQHFEKEEGTGGTMSVPAHDIVRQMEMTATRVPDDSELYGNIFTEQHWAQS